MHELGLVPLVKGSPFAVVTSALPDGPVVTAPAPGRLRRLTARALHRLATRLDGPGRYPSAAGRWPVGSSDSADGPEMVSTAR